MPLVQVQLLKRKLLLQANNMNISNLKPPELLSSISQTTYDKSSIPPDSLLHNLGIDNKNYIIHCQNKVTVHDGFYNVDWYLEDPSSDTPTYTGRLGRQFKDDILINRSQHKVTVKPNGVLELTPLDIKRKKIRNR